MVQGKSSSSIEILSSKQKRNGFHGKYLAICKSKNLAPLPEVKGKSQHASSLDFHADRVKAADWLAICGALQCDKTLESVTIRLRKNTEQVFEQADTLKKARAIVSQPQIYSNFLFTELVEALCGLLTNNVRLQSLILEGLPLRGRYVEILIKGLANNTSLKSLSFTRGNIGDDSCESICGTIQHKMNIESLSFSGCGLRIKGAESVANLIRSQRILRFSEAWTKTLRYQTLDKDSIAGLKKVVLSHNPEVGSEGLRLLTDVLIEDAWINDIEMQNCGLNDDGAQHIIACLNTNKSILIFNIAGNPEVSEHLYRHIVNNLGNGDNESSEASDPSKLPTEASTKKSLLDEVKFLTDRLDNENFRRKHAETLNAKLNQQLLEMEREIAVQGAFRVPEGFALLANETLEKLLKEKSEEIKPLRRRKGKFIVPKKSLTRIAVRPFSQGRKFESESVKSSTPKHFIERNIGDCCQVELEPEPAKPMTGASLLQLFKSRKANPVDETNVSPKLPLNFDPRSLFKNSPKLVPCNSENNSEGDSEDQ